MTRFISILSGKGGAGKTTVAINLGAALRRIGRDVIILDADITKPDMGLYFGISDFPVSLANVLKNENQITDAVYRHPCGFKIIPGGFNHDFRHHDIELKPVLEKMKGLSEIIIIDSPSGHGKDVKELLDFSDEVIVVTNPDLLSVSNALKSIKLAEESESTVLGIVLNKNKNSIHNMAVENIEAMLSSLVIAEIPNSDIIVKSRNQKKPLVYNNPNEQVSVSFKNLAVKLVGEAR